MKEKKEKRGSLSRLHILYKGRVQGVGFRYTAEMIAIKIGIKGWVKNLPNGDVEIVAEGPRDGLDDMIEQIGKSVVGPFIRKTIQEWLPYQGEFQDFRVEFYF